MINTVVFDLDGTLLDTLDDLMNSMNFALQKHGFPVRTKDEIRSFVGNGIRLLVERAVPNGITEEQLSACYDDFCEHYKLHMEDKTAPYDGINDMLSELKTHGFKTAIVTNKADFAAQDLCRRMFGDNIDLIVGSVDSRPNKPAPDGVLYALGELSVSAKNAVFVGDSDVDILTAKNAGLTSIGVLWGFRDADVLKKSGAENIVDSAGDLKNLLISMKNGSFFSGIAD